MNAPVDVFALAEKRLAWVDQRQGLLAQNIANLNTPGYSARDIRPFRDFLADEAKAAGRGAAVRDAAVASRTLDGNAVSLDHQLEKVAETDNAHQLAMNLLRKYMGLFRTAIGRS
jgi:flagellar basal-body rod protein FlgB